jgi:CubicO group peptidase (beta-lactamase class C family)
LLLVLGLLPALSCGGGRQARAPAAPAATSVAALERPAAGNEGGVASGAAFAPPAVATAAPTPVDAQTERVLDDAGVQSVLSGLNAQLEAEREQHGIAGLSVAVVYDQSIIWSEGFGQANVQTSTPATPETLYRVGSITKLFTDTMLMQLRDAGKLQLDDPISLYLPDFQLASTDTSTAPTFRQIASHTSGLPREAPLNYWRTRQFPTADALVSSLRDTSLLFPPGTGYQYSNVGVAVMGHALEQIAGEPYQQYVGEHILQPLGMTHSGLDLKDSVRAQLAHGPSNSAASASLDPYPDFAGMTPAAGLYSSVDDMARFISLQFRDGPAGGAQVLAGSSLEEMRSPASRISPASDFAIGWELGTVDGQASIGHPGVVYGFTTQITLVPDLKLGVAVFTNARTNPASIADQILDELISPVHSALAS